MGEKMNYDSYAPIYRHTRYAVGWILKPLREESNRLTDRSRIVEIGCGTANYIASLDELCSGLELHGFDKSNGMLEVAKSRESGVEFRHGDADERFPYEDGFAELLFCVDVVHHLSKYSTFFSEAFRVCKNGGKLIIVTDSEEDIRNRSLTRFFPEILDIELRRYPRVQELKDHASSAGFAVQPPRGASGYIEIDEGFIRNVREKCSSAMRLISETTFQQGLASVIEAGKKGEQWSSTYTVLRFEKKNV